MGYFAAPIFSQDPHFSQFFASPLTLNPAYTGKFNGLVRVSGNYRDQWPAISKAFVTSTLAVDAPILKGKLNSNDTWCLGGMAMTDRTANGILNSNFLSLSTAYHKALDEDGFHQLGVGFQGTYASKRLDGSQLNFENELALDGTWRFTPRFSLNARANYFKGDAEDVRGSYMNWHADVQFRWKRNFALGAGYSYTRMFVDSTDVGDSGTFRHLYRGFEAFARVSF